MTESSSASRGRIGPALRAILRTRLTTGLIVILPIWVTILLLRFVFDLMRDASIWVVHGFLGAGWLVLLPPAARERFAWLRQVPLEDRTVQIVISVGSVLLTVLILYAVGALAANVVGRRLIEAGEAIVDRLPLIKTVYRASKQILVTFTSEQSTHFQRVALIPFPTRDCRSLGFITSVFRDPVSSEELCTVFIATTPNPTTGFVFAVRRADLIELNWSVEEAVRLIMSAGILLPRPFSVIEPVQRRGGTQAPPADEGPQPPATTAAP